MARSPIAVGGTAEVLDGWLVPTAASTAGTTPGSTGRVRLSDCTSMAKALVRATPPGAMAAALGVSFPRAQRRHHVIRDGTPDGTLVVASGPGEWLLLGANGRGDDLRTGVEALAAEGYVSVVDVTHGRALLRLVGAESHRLLAKLCAIDLRDRATPNGTTFRSHVANLVTDVVRDDVDGERSYLLYCERASGRYLFDVLVDAGADPGLGAEGVALPDDEPTATR